ncbi:MerR family transcriptional regulator [Cytobacillus dafuensis]|uniref:MerR family transcriptional regulator n=1 Tax=Cytobacillus dafuensis TaxID=1742359 RepID=A0A5B8Z361_CYTDA|nr:MerR family transcriptional regulator [Cytobacillus dafuensis]QED46703.1 MerR family transcriptional regulator [Cytobacillus dafuensis]
MNEKKTFLIGEFSEKTGTSVRTLHYYDEIGLLKPDKDPSSGHRHYSDKDVLILQKIVSLKFLGYSLEQIKGMIDEPSFDVSLNESLQIQKKALEEEKFQIETALTSINRTIKLLEEEGEVDSAILMSLINTVQTEKNTREWLEQRTTKDVVDYLYNKSEDDVLSLDKEYIHLSKKVKELVGLPIEDPQVQELIEQYMKATLDFIGEEAMHALAEMDLSEADKLQEMMPSPFTKEEEDWLNQAMDYYMVQNGMVDPQNNQE